WEILCFQHFPDASIITTKQNYTIFFGFSEKFHEGIGVILLGGEEIGVVIFNVGDDADGWVEPKEHVVVFIGFDDEEYIFSGMSVCVQVFDISPKNETWIKVRRSQQVNHHGCGGGLAM